jgi:chorismate lyase / 3-hydroxybenzoate synthase
MSSVGRRAPRPATYTGGASGTIDSPAMSTAALQHDYLPMDDIARRPASWWRNVLGVVGFSKPPRLQGTAVPVTASMTPSLGAASNLCEVWRVTGGAPLELANGVPKESRQEGRVHYRFCEDFLFGSVTIDERAFEAQDATRSDGDAAALTQATVAAYGELFAVLKKTEHPHLIRVWNYLPEINREEDGDERYRHFNSARQAAFRNSGRPTQGSVPAASALGSPAGSPISIYFLAARQPPRMVENPRQTSAYRYPPKFGVHSPSFSRACVLGGSSGTSLFVSGTASIVGHETIHQGDVVAQTRETIANIDALLDEANRVVGAERYSLESLKLKVYVRQPRDLDAIRLALAASLKPAAPIVYLQADVCREELLVEIEATGEARLA